ncbi:MAG: nucleotidyltransferase family protein [Bacillota bacterium]
MPFNSLKKVSHLVDAIVLAGRRNDGKLKEAAPGCEWEALIDIGQKPMVSYVVEALQGAIDGRICIVGPRETQAVCNGVYVVPPGPTLVDNILLGLEALPGSQWVLLATCDIPMLTARSVKDFLDRCFQVKADFYYPIVLKEDAESRYPGVKRTYVRTRDGTFTGGNLMLATPAVIRSCARQAEDFIRFRKSPVKLATLVGPVFLVKFAFNLLTVAELEHKISSMFNAVGRAVQTPYAEIGVDVDKPDDLELARSVIPPRAAVL